MPTYITLARWTQQGIEKVKESPVRLDAFKQLVKSAGGDVKAFYKVMGRYDMVVVTEAPNDAAVAKVALATASKGCQDRDPPCVCRRRTEYRKIIAAL